MRIRVAKLDTDRKPEERRGLVNEGASFCLSINSPLCPFKANGRWRCWFRGAGAERGGARQIARTLLVTVQRHSSQIWAR